MSNPYLPPQASLEPDNRSTATMPSAQCAERPLGVSVVVWLFALISLARTIVEFAEGGFWWVSHLLISALIAYAYRGLWSGSEPMRKSAVWLCLVLALLIIVFGIATPSFQVDSAIGISNLLEGVYFLFAGAYLVKAGDHGFFNQTPALTTAP